mgnify:CR=1 FL=1
MIRIFKDGKVHTEQCVAISRAALKRFPYDGYYVYKRGAIENLTSEQCCREKKIGCEDQRQQENGAQKEPTDFSRQNILEHR